jgi:hypothetical protein
VVIQIIDNTVVQQMIAEGKISQERFNDEFGAAQTNPLMP